MPTKSPRINVAVEKSVYAAIERIAQRTGLSMSMVTRDLIRQALEVNEDQLLVEFAEERQSSFDKEETLSHDQVWG